MSKSALILPVIFFLTMSAVLGETQLSIGINTRVISAPTYIVTILMENHPLNTTLNSNGVIGNPNASYITSLARNASLAENYVAVANLNSLPNYIALTGGNKSLVPNNCLPLLCPVNTPNIADRIETSGRDWKAYMEDLLPGQPCTYSGPGSGHYDIFHNPFVYYSDIQDNATRCSRHVVSANSGPSGPPDDLFINDLNNLTTASNFMWLTPNNCDDMHGGSGCPSSIMTFSDNYTRQLVPKILSSLVFKTGKAALFIVWDEPTTCTVSCPIPAIWVGPTVKPHYVSNNGYNHYSYLSTLESLWALPILTPNDARAPSMIEFFL